MATTSAPPIADVLEGIPLFAGLSKRDRRRLAKGMKERVFAPGREVVTEGRTGAGFFIILEGTAAVTIGGTIVRTLGPGDSFGELALIDGQARAATVTADTELRCLTETLFGFKTFVQSQPAVAWAMLQALARIARENATR
ncbi:cyclic nucleotide-binding domain-containing protein [Baekduia soli]|uniref:Cyclic nucleotide-binding domain-containing protein n=1 Tax=Baekduia soli TaxID=496014 RepID=A0A5B8UAM9_9ACTN|nr:cyclic nucleotide-binding domain-containing protein [Baekduia soli]QEC49671.1 cyclic nucleotide-binding domain-containing protein [Baekduia soli]